MKNYTSKYDEFVITFRVREISVVRTDFHNTYHTAFENSLRFNDGFNELVEIKIDRTGLESLVDVTGRCRELTSKIEEEKRLRDTYPSLDELYSKYSIMLELYR